MRFDEAAALAGEKAIEAAGIDRSEIGMMVNTSVCRHHLEPSVACAVHHHLGLAPGCLNFDLGNACLGFVNAIHLAATAIDAGQISYALIVDGEGARLTHETTIKRLQETAQVTQDVYEEFASLTLGSGSAAMVLGSLDKAPDAHRLVGGISRAATQHHQICIGDLEQMTTDTKALLEGGLALAGEAWAESADDFGWNERHRLVRHPPGQLGAHAADVRHARPRRGARAAHLPGVRQHRPGLDPVHAGAGPGRDQRQATGCSAWAWAPG